MSKIVSWLHFGDLHISGFGEQNYADFLKLLAESNRHLSADLEFALLPGDNADDGEEDEYQLVQQAIARCLLPVHAIPGDHDFAAGSLALFRQYLEESLYRSFSRSGYHFVFLNSVAEWRPPVFGLGKDQLDWLRADLAAASANRLTSVLFLHAYPSEHGADSEALSSLIKEHRVAMVEMGHTHYNELANDGQTIYAATRSTGQVEEGPPGFSITSLDDSVVSWRFKPMGEWPFVAITSPADYRLIVNSADPAQVVRESIPVRARVWGPEIESVTLYSAAGQGQRMSQGERAVWSGALDLTTVPDGLSPLTVRARTRSGSQAEDRILVQVSRDGRYEKPPGALVDYENAFGAWAEKHILGTQLGPNENGRAWPPRKGSQKVRSNG